MKALQKVSKFLSDYTSIVVIAIAVVTFLVPNLMAWVNQMLFVIRIQQVHMSVNHYRNHHV